MITLVLLTQKSMMATRIWKKSFSPGGHIDQRGESRGGFLLVSVVRDCLQKNLDKAALDRNVEKCRGKILELLLW